jgi:hypothetical protein
LMALHRLQRSLLPVRLADFRFWIG